MKPPLRTKSVGTKVSEAEFALLEERARAAGLTLSEWVREALLAGPVEMETGEIVLAELLASVPTRTAGTSITQLKEASRELLTSRRPNRRNPIWVHRWKMN